MYPNLKDREVNPEPFRSMMTEYVAYLLSLMRYGDLTGVGGVSLSTLHVPALESMQRDSSASFVIIPGRTESFLKYAELIHDLTREGHEVFTLDHRGQGFSERLIANPHVGFVSDFADYQSDIISFLTTIVSARKSFKRCYVLAHSMGAAVVLGLVLDAQKGPGSTRSVFFENVVSGLILSAPMLAIRLGTPQWLTEVVVGLRCLFGKAKTFAIDPGSPDIATYGKDLTHSALRLQWYRDLLTSHPEIQLGMPSNQWMREALRYTRELRDRLRHMPLHLPVLLLTPGRDEVVDVEVQELITGPYDGDLLERLHLPHAAHDPFIETDAVRAVVVDRILDFVSD